MNGVYAFAASSAFPTNAYNSTNFWVDVVFMNSSSTNSPSLPQAAHYQTLRFPLRAH